MTGPRCPRAIYVSFLCVCAAHVCPVSHQHTCLSVDKCCSVLCVVCV